MILSIYFGFHDSNVALASKKEILLSLEAERVFRIKHARLESSEQMDQLIALALDYLNISIRQIDQVLLAKWNNKYSFDKSGKISVLGKKFTPIMTSHHENHIGTSFANKYKECLIVCADGGSEDGTSKIYLNDQKGLSELENLDNTIMNGRFYGTLTQLILNPRCSTAHNSDAGKTMGLAAIGRANKETYKKIKDNLGLFNNLYFDGADELRERMGIGSDYGMPWLDKTRTQFAYEGHRLWVDFFYNKIKEYSEKSENLVIVGGCALNIDLNSKLLSSRLFKNIYITPVSPDNGQALGAILFQNPTISCNYPFLGRGFGEIANNHEEVAKSLVDDLLQGKIIAWYQGRSEIGPRALGHRSFLGLPNSDNMRKKLSEKIKKREPYRPVAPIVLGDRVNDYFYFDGRSRFMTFSAKARQITEEEAPAIVHTDGTSRIQTLSKEDNPVLYRALRILEGHSVPPIIMNSSLNIAGEPIVDTPEEAFRTFKASGADVLYINGERSEK